MSQLDQAIREVRAEPIPAGPSAALIGSTLRAIDHAEIEALPLRRPLCEGRGRAVGVLALLAVGISVLAFLVGGGAKALAFADVLAQLREHDSVSFTHRYFTLADNHPRLEEHWSVSGSHVRIDLSETLCQITDQSSREILELDLVAKTACRSKLSEEALQAFVDPIQQLRNLAEEDGVHVRPETQPDGSVLDLYYVAQPKLIGYRFTPLLPMQVWVDRELGLPVRIRLQTSFNRNDVKEQDHLEWVDFDWEPEFKAGWFELEVPEGYEQVGK